MNELRNGQDRRGNGGDAMLLFRVGQRVCALEGGRVSETMRPLPIEPLPAMPSFVLGLSIVRGRPVPVVDGRRLLGLPAPAGPRAFIALRSAERPVVLAVDAVIGVARSVVDAESFPSLLGDAEAGTVEAIGSRDAELLLVLRGARLLPEELWTALERAERGEVHA